MPRALLALVLCTGLGVAGQDSTDPVRQKLDKAKVKYEQARTQYREAVRTGLDEKEKSARAAGNKKLLDQIVAEREAFAQAEEHPASVAKFPLTRFEAARKEREKALETAIKELTKAGRDLTAAEVEGELRELRRSASSVWQYLDTATAGATANDGFLRIQKETLVPTKREYTGPVEIVMVARTELENIRVLAHRGSCVIFNWELNPKQLRVHRPDGNNRLESGSIATAPVTPLKANTWYTLRWRLTAEGMSVSVDGKVVFAEQRAYDLSAPSRITVKAATSQVDVKEFSVLPAKDK